LEEEASSMFERFTEKSRKTVVLAQEEARRFNHSYIGTEHLLLGLLRLDEGVAAQTLTSLGVTLRGAREQVESIVGYGEEETGAQAPFTPRSKKTMELALRESMQLGHNYISTEHILLGLAREKEGVAASILSNLEVDAYRVRREVVRRLGGETSPVPEETPLVEVGPREYGREPLLFRGQVESLRITVRLDGQSETLLLDLDYAYTVQDAADASSVMDHDDILTEVAGVLVARELGSVEAGVWRVGQHVLEGFPAIREVTVSATDQRMLEAHTVAGFKVIRTFSR
jgi:Clp amino terminal domain, pathogenicity island component